MTRFILTIFISLLVATPVAARDLTVFAAASLKEPLDSIAAEFDGVTVSYGGSGAIARQVGLGAPADVVLLANEAWMTVLVDDGVVRPETVMDFASNALVLIAPGAADPVALTPDAFAQGLGDGPLAIGFPASVPAGIYGKAALENLGLWHLTEGKRAEVDNVRSALALVARGEAPLGIVYQSDARVVPNVAVVATFPADSHPPIRYTAAVTVQSTHPRAADFVAALAQDTAQQAFISAAFCPVAGC